MSQTTDPQALAGGILSIDLAAIRENYRILSTQLQAPDCAAVVKANGYGLGMQEVSKALWEAGARTFFVALADEAIALRQTLHEADIHLLSGPFEGSEDILVQNRITPVLNSFDQIKRWANRGPSDLHLDTGMTRLGIAPSDWASLPADLNTDIVMSHFACADDPNHPLNAQQIDAFTNGAKMIKHQRASLANSSGVFLSADAHFDLGRPGCALYGINPTPHTANPMKNPVRLQGKIIQIHSIDTQTSVGYGATHALKAGMKIATIALGYADGYLRHLSSKGHVYIDDLKCNVVGRVSMDMIAIDITHIPENLAQANGWVDVIGPHNPPDLLAEQAGTIGYEILTSLGARYLRVYSG